MAKTLMVQGASSDAGKSMLVTGLCAYFRRQGLRVAPFKAWNMSLNSYVTQAGEEIGFAQGLQAKAAGVVATGDMNPFLLKPRGDGRVQVILRGTPWKDITPGHLASKEREFALDTIRESFEKVAQDYDLVLIEGAGSPSEINVRPRDLANMETAFLTGAPVLIIGDMKRGGLTQLIGTWELISQREQGYVKGWVINRTQRDTPEDAYAALLRQHTGLPLVGNVREDPAAAIQAEDAASLKVGGGSGDADFSQLAAHMAQSLDTEAISRIIEEGC